MKDICRDFTEMHQLKSLDISSIYSSFFMHCVLPGLFSTYEVESTGFLQNLNHVGSAVSYHSTSALLVPEL